MSTLRRSSVLVSIGAVLLVAWAVGASQLPAAGAGGLLHPARHPLRAARPAGCQDARFSGEGLELAGWRCPAAAARIGTLVYLHGIADNRASGVGIVDRFVTRGFDVVAYDSRAHGESGGDACTYGVFERQDLHRVLDTVGAGPIVLFGTSLGAAVALQDARDSRVSAVIAVEIFSDLRTVASRATASVSAVELLARPTVCSARQRRH